MSKRKKSPEKILKNNGADIVYERDSNTINKINMRAKRKDLKSANVKTYNERVL